MLARSLTQIGKELWRRVGFFKPVLITLQKARTEVISYQGLSTLIKILENVAKKLSVSVSRKVGLSREVSLFLFFRLVRVDERSSDSRFQVEINFFVRGKFLKFVQSQIYFFAVQHMIFFQVQFIYFVKSRNKLHHRTAKVIRSRKTWSTSSF